MFHKGPEDQTKSDATAREASQIDDFLLQLEEKLRLRNERTLRRLLAWGERARFIEVAKESFKTLIY